MAKYIYDKERDMMVDKETGLPMLKIESDYDAAEIGPMRTRVETFVEGLKTSKKNRR